MQLLINRTHSFSNKDASLSLSSVVECPIFVFFTLSREQQHHPNQMSNFLRSISREDKAITWPTDFCYSSKRGARDWSRNKRHSRNQSRFKTKANLDLAIRVFPRFRQFPRFYLEVFLASSDVFILSDGLL